MHQAIEAKEGVEIKAENQTLATITLQNYFRLYATLSGMTGTAATEANEFMSTYKIGVVPIPTNMPMIRADQTDVVYKTEAGKFDAVVEDIVARHRAGQPILVGTTSVEKSEYLSKLLRKVGVPHEVLNAKQHAREAAIVAQAGRKGAVTVATNMAGRGTDIMLGGNAEFMAVEALAAEGLDSTENPDEYEAAWPRALAEAKESVAAEHDEVVTLGGLYVLGTERHESRRIDNQLRGRSGRQGDPGESRFYLSLQDDLMRLFNSALTERVMNSVSFPEDVPLESKMVTRGIASAQSQVEARNFEIRKNVLKYDDVMSRQRTVVYDERRRILHGADLAEQIQSFITDVVDSYVTEATTDPAPEDWNLDGLWTSLREVFPASITPGDVIDEVGGLPLLTAQTLKRELLADAELAYSQREEKLTPEIVRQVERRVLLSVLDRKWREHLYEMDYLKEGIGLRGMAQRDPLVEYQREGYQLFQAMNEAIKEETVGYLFNLQVNVEEDDEDEDDNKVDVEEADEDEFALTLSAAPTPSQATVTSPLVAATAKAAAKQAKQARAGGKQPAQAKQSKVSGKESASQEDAGQSEGQPTRTATRRLDESSLGPRPRSVPLQYSAPSETGDGTTTTAGAAFAKAGGRRGAAGAAPVEDPSADGLSFPGTARNAQCPCGSGKKYKLCHGKNESS
jgi:preprotein translocase subunit SecA